MSNTHLYYKKHLGVNLEYIGIAVGSIGLLFGAFAVINLFKLRKRFEAALGGDPSSSIEKTLASHLKRVEDVDKRLIVLTKEYEELLLKNGFASQKISIVRFNPFGDTGGDQSFTLAVLDSHDSGYVLTSIHGREGTRVYVKPIDYGKSKYTLSTEEQQALGQATKRVPKAK